MDYLINLYPLHDALVATRGVLEDINSEYPETKAFLKARGLTNVRELDDAGKAELMAHLALKVEQVRPS